jgi:hypothetical protein
MKSSELNISQNAKKRISDAIYKITNYMDQRNGNELLLKWLLDERGRHVSEVGQPLAC